MEEKILEKIQKLIALQEDAKDKGSLEESANAAAKVQALLLKHNLDMEQVNGHSKEEVILKTISGKGIGWNKRQGKWVHSLYNGICTHNFGKLVLGTGWDKEEVKLHIMAEKSNLEVIEYLGYTLTQKILNLQSIAWRKYSGSDLKGTFRRGYLQGATLGILSKLREQREAAIEANDQVAGLVLVKSKKVEEFTEEQFPNLRKDKGSSTKASDAAIGMGFRDGRAQDINAGVGQGTAKGELNG